MSEKLSRIEFDVLAAVAEAKAPLGPQEVRLAAHASDDARAVYESLVRRGWVRGGIVTDEGLAALEPYRAKRAVFMAAGFGSRMVPVTLNTPKPLVRVHGKRIIDSLLDACLAAGIAEIYVVRGYLAEQFDQLLYKYPMIRFIENPAYNEANNISSAVAACRLLQNAYVFESDLWLRNPAVITRYHYGSDVLGIYKSHTDDWCLTQKDGFVDEEKVGGDNCHQMVGIYYFNAQDGARVGDDLAAAYAAPDGKSKYWETVPNQMHRGKYKIEIRDCTNDDVTEIDTFRELQAIDSAYNLP